MACGILVPTLGMGPAPPAVEARSSNHWAAREVLMGNLSNSELFIKRAALFLPLDVAASQQAPEVLK